jgi:hypothetical protein
MYRSIALGSVIAHSKEAKGKAEKHSNPALRSCNTALSTSPSIKERLGSKKYNKDSISTTPANGITQNETNSA